MTHLGPQQDERASRPPPRGGKRKGRVARDEINPIVLGQRGGEFSKGNFAKAAKEIAREIGTVR